MAKRAAPDAQLTLWGGMFDQPTPVAHAAPSPVPSMPARGEWQEVPAARFLSWSPAEQLAYCLARDKASLGEVNFDDGEWQVEFFHHRIVGYQKDLEGIRGNA